MSADNGIYILNLKNQSRVIHAQAIDNLWWSFVNFDSNAEDFVSTRIVEYFGGSIKFEKRKDAESFAFKLAKDYTILEYGISNFDIDKTWNDIVKDAKELATLEIQAIKNRPIKEWQNKSDWYTNSIELLQSILEMEGD
jgi:hypothetical protein